MTGSIIPKSWIYNNGNQIFYHIVLPEIFNPNNTKGVCNFIDEKGISKFKLIGGSIHWVLRIGGQNSYEVFIENNRHFSDNNKMKVKPAHGNSIGKHFIEQYLPVPYGMEFTRKCMVIFEKIWKEYNETGEILRDEVILKKNIIEVFGDDKNF